MNEKRILIAKSDLTAAANSGAMAPQDVETLWTALEATSRSPQERSFDIALRTRHRSWDELNAYQVHPIHQEVLKHMKSVVEKSVAVDWEA